MNSMMEVCKLTDFLISRFVKNPSEVKNKDTRESYGLLVSVVGIIFNLILFSCKLIIGFLINSVAVMADAFNNLSDTCTSIISMVGFKLINKPPDEEHPFGHGRAEYVVAQIIAFLILLLGYEFLKTSVIKVFNPEPVTFSGVAILILLATVLAKIWLSVFSRNIGERINSKILVAAAIDAKNDVIVTSFTIVSILITYFTGIIIDGIAGIFVSLILLKCGYDIAVDTISIILGQKVDPKLSAKIKQKVEAYEGIEGTHDLIVHNYGQSQFMASIHAEVSKDVNIEISHQIIDRIEREVADEMEVLLVIHMDPISVNDERIKEISQQMRKEIEKIDTVLDIHEFRFVQGGKHMNLIFDLTVPHSYDENDINRVCEKLRNVAESCDEEYHCIINVERSFV